MTRIRPQQRRQRPVVTRLPGRTLMPLALAIALPAMAEEQATQPHLGWYPRAQLSAEETAGLPDFCHGNYRQPDIVAVDGEQI